MRFQNRSNKVVIELRAVQFWFEIIFMISNRTRAARSFDFEITRMISDQIALHSVQLPSCITLGRIEEINIEKMTTKHTEEYFFHQSCEKMSTNLEMASRF